jgi:uncharacterized repeat protein (TIGR03803 family)
MGQRWGGKSKLCLFGCGAIFELDTAGKLHVLYEFTGGKDGNYAVGPLVQDAAGSLYGTAVYGGNLCCPQEPQYGCGTVFKLAPSGQFTVLHAFTGGSDGALPQPGLLLDQAGNLYGAAVEGGSTNCEDPSGPPTGCGTLFKLSSKGKFTVLHFVHWRNGRERPKRQPDSGSRGKPVWDNGNRYYQFLLRNRVQAE